ncbi:hypothetical protein EON80_19595 [bacterium]|nr:MAG: hypothetical protein EON80_19595 [bacterium]
MKSSALTEMDYLRSEVRHLRESVVELENRLAEYESEDEDENPWGVWPYCWVVQGWQQSERQVGVLQQKWERWNLSRSNQRKVQLAKQKPLTELHLT